MKSSKWKVRSRIESFLYFDITKFSCTCIRNNDIFCYKMLQHTMQKVDDISFPKWHNQDETLYLECLDCMQVWGETRKPETNSNVLTSNYLCTSARVSGKQQLKSFGGNSIRIKPWETLCGGNVSINISTILCSWGWKVHDSIKHRLVVG